MTTQNPNKYRGSGVYWKNHLKIHGNDVMTEILKECDSNEDLKKWGIYYSELYDVVKSEYFANLVLESGENSCGMTGKRQSERTKNKIKQSLMNHNVSEITRMKLREKLKGNIPWNKNKKGEYHIFTETDKMQRSVNMTGNNNPFYSKSHSEEFKIKQALNQKRLNECPHCNKIGAIRIMKRWHFDNCKNKEMKRVN